jgi:hypothetical protein
MLSKTLFIDRKYVFYAKRAYPRVKKERKIFVYFIVFSQKAKRKKIPFDIKTSLCHIETRALDKTRSKAEADAMGN